MEDISCTQLTIAIAILVVFLLRLHLVLWRRLPEQVELPPADLGPTASLTQTLTLLREVLASHDSSVVPLDARQADFAQVNTCFWILKNVFPKLTSLYCCLL